MTGAALSVNGVSHVLDGDDRRLLSDTVADDCGLPGTRTGCHEGVCGTCTVLLDGDPVRSCLVLTRELTEGSAESGQPSARSVETVEGVLAGPDGELIRTQFGRHFALQCGYCTPGFMVLAQWLLRSGRSYGYDEIRDAAASNLCRCTGYRPILAALADILAARGLLADACQSDGAGRSDEVAS